MKNKNEEGDLKPVVFIKGEDGYHRNNRFQQNLLLKSLQVTTDPQELKKMIGVKTVAEVFRTLDKLSIRKEYHEALVKNGIDLNTIIQGIKKEGDSADSAAIRLKAWQVLLKSLGLDDYKGDEEHGTKDWQDLLKEIVEKKPKELNKKQEEQAEEYEVTKPEIPASEKRRIEEEEADEINIHEDNK